jgi:DNA-binding MarR family transcriptional regulator
MNALAQTNGNAMLQTKQQGIANKTANPIPGSRTAPDSLMSKMNFILHTMRSKRISMSSLHAVTSLYLNQGKQVSLGVLASNLGVTSAAITNVADGMERLGFARRRTNDHDRRLTWISLTPRGIAFAEWFQSAVSSGIATEPSSPVTHAVIVG